eukprot:TRINITY_DN27489_c0_g1_i1.p1 TRINITY_DN27489_c0_g1~~TRINITY_DN27489_c0_g1_i1.p1  ORF type:complete len:192 (-),score=40.80 TRINITY_DN27489_c0_g1_i1:812-1387(-)
MKGGNGGKTDKVETNLRELTWVLDEVFTESIRQVDKEHNENLKWIQNISKRLHDDLLFDSIALPSRNHKRTWLTAFRPPTITTGASTHPHPDVSYIYPTPNQLQSLTLPPLLLKSTPIQNLTPNQNQVGGNTNHPKTPVIKGVVKDKYKSHQPLTKKQSLSNTVVEATAKALKIPSRAQDSLNKKNWESFH